MHGIPIQKKKKKHLALMSEEDVKEDVTVDMIIKQSNMNNCFVSVFLWSLFLRIINYVLYDVYIFKSNHGYINMICCFR